MIEIELQPIANQSLSVTLEGVRWDITLWEANGVMCADVSRDDVLLLSAQRVVAGEPIIPYAFLVAGGNFAIYTEADALPYYTEFGLTQTLLYASAAELAGA